MSRRSRDLNYFRKCLTAVSGNGILDISSPYNDTSVSVVGQFTVKLGSGWSTRQRLTCLPLLFAGVGPYGVGPQLPNERRILYSEHKYFLLSRPCRAISVH